MNKAILHIGLDVHAQTITIAVAEGAGEARLYGTISSDLHSVDKFLAKLRKAHPDATLRWCYEAGPTGFVLQRHIARKGMECLVAAPSLIPGRSGDKVKTDKRDAVSRAKRDSQRAEPLPEGRCRKAAATWRGSCVPAN